jgi:hypothetical protein
VQSRTALHVSADLAGKEGGLAVTGWLVGNLRSEFPDNGVALAGLGFRGDHFFLELMAGRQWSKGPDATLFDVRLQAQHGDQTIFLQLAPYLSDTRLLAMFFTERPLGPFRTGVEFEALNTHTGFSWGVGPRASLRVYERGSTKVVGSLAYQFVPGKMDVARFYLVLHQRF